MLAILAESALRSLILGSAVWVGLNLLRVRNPHVHMTSWLMVLLASLSMPLLMHWDTVTVTLDALPAPAEPWSTGFPWTDPLDPPLPPEQGLPVAAGNTIYQAIGWRGVAAVIYACVTGMLLLRLAVGIYLTWRLARAARPISEPWAANSNVRVSTVITGPVTFGSTILLPPQFIGWDSLKRRAVIAHESAHVANRDFYVLLLASLNRAVFWFSPFAWWQLIRLAELAEIISDAQAIEVFEDRLGYAEILLDLVQNVKKAPAGLQMARACTVRARVERILAVATQPPGMNWRKRFWIVAAILPVVIVSAGTIAYRTEPAPGFTADGPEKSATAVRTRQAADFYSFGSMSVFAIFRQGDDLFGQLTGQRKLRLSAMPDGSFSYPAAAGQITFTADAERRPSELTFHQNGRDLRATRIAELPRSRSEGDAARLDQYAGWYQLSPSRVLAVTRDGGRVYARETGQTRFEVTADGADTFYGEHGDPLIFLRDDQGKVTELLFDDTSGARRARRVDAAMAKAAEEDFTRRIVQVPDRFRDQIPTPGSKEAILRGIADMQSGTPNYDRMSAPLAAKIRGQAPQLHGIFLSLGAVESTFFRGVGPGGYDIYGVKFANGSAEFRLLLGADGKADDVIFRPDGNDEPGGVAACSEEARLKSRDGNAPIKILIYNSTSDDIQLYNLDDKGNRRAHGAIGDDMSSSILTTVDSPWIVADRSGQCLEIVLPGQRTRYHIVETSGGNARPEWKAPARTTPLAGSEEMLRQYIEAMGRGEPNYDRMTSEVAAQTRRQLPFDQAILAKLGPLRAISFRGVSALSSDIYIGHFANGSAEWRIGLAKDGTIGRIALGPQY